MTGKRKISKERRDELLRQGMKLRKVVRVRLDRIIRNYE